MVGRELHFLIGVGGLTVLGAKDHTNVRILQTMISGTSLVVGLIEPK